MAEVKFEPKSSDSFNDPSLVCVWQLGDGDMGEEFAGIGAASVQVDGVFDGGSVEIHGSNDGESFYPLSDAHGSALILSSAKIKAIAESCRYIRPVAVGGEKMNVKVTILVRKG